MKRGVTVNFDYHEDCYEISKKKGILDLDEIQEALTEYYCSDEYFFIKIKTGTWDDWDKDVAAQLRERIGELERQAERYRRALDILEGV